VYFHQIASVYRRSLGALQGTRAPLGSEYGFGGSGGKRREEPIKQQKAGDLCGYEGLWTASYKKGPADLDEGFVAYHQSSVFCGTWSLIGHDSILSRLWVLDLYFD
jgi:hypothetical protein